MSRGEIYHEGHVKVPRKEILLPHVFVVRREHVVDSEGTE
jgi:hypothetical protein